MTDKELHHLKRAELIEILFYMQSEIEKLKQENQSLQERVETLTQNALDNKLTLSDETIDKINQTIQQTVKNCLEKSEENENSERSSD